MVVLMYQPRFLCHPDVVYVVPQLNFALGSINVASQLPALQSIWPSAWCLVPPMSSDPKSALRTRCEMSLLLSCPLLSALSCSLSFLFLKIPIYDKPALQQFGELKASFIQTCLTHVLIFLCSLFRWKFRVCSFVCKGEFRCRLASIPCVSVPQVGEQCEEQCWTGIKHSAG